MNRRSILLYFGLTSIGFMHLIPTAKANPFVRLLLSILRQAITKLIKRGSKRYSYSSIRKASARTSINIPNQNKIRDVFREKKYEIQDKNGRRLGTARVDNDILLFQDNKGKLLGYAQVEKDGISLYGGDAKHLMSFRKKGTRVVAYDKEGEYAGQIIKEYVEDEIKSYFIDSLGNKYNGIPLQTENGKNIEMIEHRTSIVDGVLEVRDENNQKVLYGKNENGTIVFYNLSNEIKVKLTKNNNVISVYSPDGDLLGEYTSNNKSIPIPQ